MILKKPKYNRIDIYSLKYSKDIQEILEDIKKSYLVQQTYFSNIFDIEDSSQSQRWRPSNANIPKKHEFKLENHLTYNDQKINKYICAKIVKPGQIVIECLNCGIYDNAIMCIECFYNSNHKDHKYKTKKANGGCCDCGDIEVWRKEGFCKNHSGEKQEIILSEEQKNQFNRVWKHIFYWYFAMIVQYPSSYSSFGEQILKFLKKLTALNIRYIGLISNLFDQILQADKFKLIDDMNDIPILDVILKYVFNQAQIQDFCYLFITMFGNYEFRKTLTVCFIRNYQCILKNEELRFWSLSCQLLTHEELILHVLEKGYLLVYKSHQGLSNIFMLSGYLYHSYKYITQSKNIALKYWKAHIESKFKIISTCLYIDYVEKNWKNNIADSEISFNFPQQTLHLELICKIANEIRSEKSLLEKCIYDLYEQITSKEVKNSFFLPYHRAFTIFLFTYFNFDITLHLEQKIKSLEKILKKDRSEFNIQKIIEPIIRCLLEFLRMRNQSNYRQLHYNFWRDYRSSKSLDIILLKFCLLMRPIKLFEIKKIVPEEFSLLLSDNIDIKMSQIGFQTLNKHIQFLSLLTQLSLSKTEQLNIYCEISQTQNKYEDYAVDLLQRYANQIKVCTHGDFESFNRQFLNEIINFSSIIKTFTKFDKLTKRFTYTGTNQHKLLDIEYFISKLKTISQIKSEKYVQKLDLTFPLNANSSLIINNYFTEETYNKIYNLVSNLLEFINKSYQQNIFMKPATSCINDILKQIIKVYKIYQASLVYNFDKNNINTNMDHQNKSKIDLIKKLLGSVKDCKKLREPIQKHISEILIEKTNPDQMELQLIQKNQQKVSKLSREEIKRKRIEQIKNKQKKFQNFVAKNNTIQQDKNEKEESDDICVICKRELIQQQCVFPAIIQYTNMYQQSKLRAFEKIINKQAKDQKLQQQYVHLKKLGSLRLVFTSCSHPFHLKCIEKQKKMSTCMLCKRFYNILIPQIIKKTTENVLNNFFTTVFSISPSYYKQYMQKQNENGFLKLIESFQEILGYIGTIDPEYFIKRILKSYQQILNILKLKFSLLEQDQKDDFEEAITKQSPINNQNNFGVLQTLTNETVKKFIKNEKISLEEELLKRYSNDNKFNQQLIKRVCLLKLLIDQTCPKNNFKICLETITHSKNIIPQEIKFNTQLEIEEFSLRQLPTRYSPLNKYRTNCPNCKQILRPGVLCLLCEWQGCLKCPVMKLQTHCHNNHGENSIFMVLDTTMIIIMSYQFAFIDRPIYQNQYGEPFQIFGEWQHFELDINLYNKLKKSLSQYNLLSYIIYEAQRVSHSNYNNLFHSNYY